MKRVHEYDNHLHIVWTYENIVITGYYIEGLVSRI